MDLAAKKKLAARRLRDLADAIRQFEGDFASLSSSPSEGAEAALPAAARPDFAKMAAAADTLRAYADRTRDSSREAAAREARSSPSRRARRRESSVHDAAQASHSVDPVPVARGHRQPKPKPSAPVTRVRYDIERAKEMRRRLDLARTTTGHTHSAKVFETSKLLSVPGDPAADTYSSLSKRVHAAELVVRARERAMTPAHEMVYPLPSVAIAARLGVC
jgi:hypothetical protein